MKNKLILMVFGLIAATGFTVVLTGCDKRPANTEETGTYRSPEEGIFSFKVGQFEVFTLVEGRREGNAGILLGIDEGIINNYIPESGFLHSTNAFLIKADGKYILVDAGTGRQYEPVYEKIKRIGVEPGQVDTILLTHLHGDHFGGLVSDELAAFPGATVYLSAKEHDFFFTENPNENAVNSLGFYKTVTFEPGELGSELQAVVPGVFPVAAYGHTPGHTMFLVENDGSKLLIWGDLMHVGLIQFPMPEISAVYDTDPEVSSVIRKKVMDYAAENKIPVAGMHIMEPGIGTLEPENDGFIFNPIE